jgi:hypothetical protein
MAAVFRQSRWVILGSAKTPTLRRAALAPLAMVRGGGEIHIHSHAILDPQ